MSLLAPSPPRSRSRTSWPPGPTWPASAQTAAWVTRSVPMMEQCMRRYGDCFRLSLVGFESGREHVFVAGPDTVTQVLTGNPQVLRAGEANGIVEPVGGPSCLARLDGEAHLRKRRMMLPSFHGADLVAYAAEVDDVTDARMRSWPTGSPFALLTVMTPLTLDVILRIVFGLRAGDDLRRLSSAVPRLFQLGAAMGLLQRVRRDWSAASLTARFRRASEEVDAVVFEQIEARQGDPRLDERTDILSRLLIARDDRGAALSTRQLRDELVSLVWAGHATTAAALAWCLERLMHDRPRMERVRAELADGGQDYTDAVIKETLRLYPVLPFVMRRAAEPVTLREYEVPAGTILGACLYLLHRRDDVYDDAAAFRPERFLGAGRAPAPWLPFGGGTRRCLGASFATLEMRRVLARLLATFDLEPVEPRVEPVRRGGIIIEPAGGARAVLTRRGTG